MIFGSPEFELAPGIRLVDFSERALQYLYAHRQVAESDRERGGQLFARFDSGKAEILEATGPHTGARAGRFWFKGHRKTERREITRQFKADLHYLGDWHSHPQPVPIPSMQDYRTHSSLVAKSDYELHGLIMVIIGQADLPESLSVTFKGRGSRPMPLELLVP